MYKLPATIPVLCFLFALSPAECAAGAADQNPSPSVDQILSAYVRAAGGEAAIDAISTREIHANEHHGPKLTYYWQKPDRLLVIEGTERIGYDGRSGWVLSKKKRLTRLPKGEQSPLEMDANSLRYTHLKRLYSELDCAPPQEVNGRMMDLIQAPNAIGSTKFYFDRETHLLAQIDEFGDTSAYYTHSTLFSDYKRVGAVVLPFRIVHKTNEPGVSDRDVRVSEVEQNVPLESNLFTKPVSGAVVLGGKR
jgi:hypothetical protein